LPSAADPRRQNAYWTGADLVIEVVSPDDPQRDLVTKRSEYAQAGIPEYWIVDPQTETITVLRLEDARYVEHGVFRPGRGRDLRPLRRPPGAGQRRARRAVIRHLPGSWQLPGGFLANSRNFTPPR
jgi:hypothetical protein